MNPITTELKDGRRLTIREARGQDAEMVLAYVHRVSAETDFLTFGPGEFEHTLAEENRLLEDFHTAANQIYLLAFVNDTLAGSLNFRAGSRPRLRHSGELGITVLQDFWGCGVASALLDTLITWAQTGGLIRKLNLQVRSDNRRAITLYQKKGFQVEGQLRRSIFLEGNFYDNLAMGLEIDP